MDTVALAATIGGSLVGLAGVGATAWSSWQQRKSATELATRQQGHERELARGERLFERRAAVYEEMLRLLYVWDERVRAATAIIRQAGDPAVPELPSPEELLQLQARFGTVCSPAVADAFEEFFDVLHKFSAQARKVDNIRVYGGGDMEKELAAAQEAGKEVRAMVPEFQRLVSDELSAL